jgi:hypothetical protein
MILEEFTESDSVFLDLSLNLKQQGIKILLSLKCLSLTEVCRLLTSCCLLRSTLEWISIVNEVEILDIILFVAVVFDKRIKFFVGHSEA